MGTALAQPDLVCAMVSSGGITITLCKASTFCLLSPPDRRTLSCCCIRSGRYSPSRRSRRRVESGEFFATPTLPRVSARSQSRCTGSKFTICFALLALAMLLTNRSLTTCPLEGAEMGRGSPTGSNHLCEAETLTHLRHIVCSAYHVQFN